MRSTIVCPDYSPTDNLINKVHINLEALPTCLALCSQVVPEGPCSESVSDLPNISSCVGAPAAQVLLLLPSPPLQRNTQEKAIFFSLTYCLYLTNGYFLYSRDIRQ